MKQYLEVTYRDIAKMLASALPVEGEDFREVVETHIQTIKALPKDARIALKTAYVFSRKVPREEREDLFQDLALAVLKVKTEDERLAYTVARFDWKDFWRQYKTRSHYSLDTVIEEEEGSATTLAELLVGEVEFERKINGKLDAERIFDSLPAKIKPLVDKRLIGKSLNSTERTQMQTFIKTQGYKLLLA